jgi:hypothetical protein
MLDGGLAMVQSEEIRQLLRKRPFQPFRLHLADGRTFTIEYPELNVVTGTFMAIGIPVANDPDPVAERVCEVDLAAMAGVELLAQPSAWKPR